jgi:ribosomal protein RSM22 (predicted rRNA methylase)
MNRIETLKALRQNFLNPQGIQGNYWDSVSTLKVYDEFFGRRNENKISFILADVFKRNPQLVERLRGSKKIHIGDWGCGPGTFARTFASTVAKSLANDLNFHFYLHDHSELAIEYAQKTIRSTFENQKIEFSSFSKWEKSTQSDELKVFLMSHVLNEKVTENHLLEILKLAQGADLVVMVESGRQTDSNNLVHFRNRFLNQNQEFQVLGPCPHSLKCKIADSGESNWCHFNFRPPAQDSQDGEWVKAHKAMGVDFRFLSASFIFLTRANTALTKQTVSVEKNHFRVLGTPRDLKGRIEVVACFDTGEIDKKNISKKLNPMWYKETSKKIDQNREILLGSASQNKSDLERGEWI